MAFNFAAPAQPGFSFAGGAAAAGNPPSAATGTTGGFGNFGVGASFSLGQQQQLMGSSLPSLGAPSTAPPPPTLPTITVPPYKEIFPNRSIWCKISDLLHSLSAQDDYSEDATLAGQELIHLLDSMQLQEPRSIASGLLAPRSNQLILEPVQPDIALRQRLFQNPLIVLSIEHEDGSILLQEATLTQSMLTDICSIADDLQITEVAAICLYHQASSAKAKFRSRFVQACLKDSTIVTKDDTSLAWMARDIFFAQSPLRIRTCLLLLQWRLREGNQDRSQNPVSEATDALFQSDWIGQLIRLVRDYTRRIDVTIAAINAHAAGHGPSISNSLEPCRENDSLFWRHNVVLRMCMKERQSTAECLFFAAYHVQLTVDEVGALIDLTQELSNGALILDPFTDVPDPYESAARENPSAGVAHWLMRDSSRSEKDQLNWQRELASAAWQTGQPQLLRCTCGIAMAIISALGDRAILNDRTSHLPNSFGTGNALLPPGSFSLDGLAAVYSRLNKESMDSWRRSDMLGLLMASFALLLRSSPHSLSSPRASGATESIAIDIRKAFRQCLEAPTELKSFSFARIAVIPALRIPFCTSDDDYTNSVAGASCDPSEFLLSVLAEFSSRYLDVLSSCGDNPISRAKWEQDAEDDIRLRRTHLEQQQSFRGQFSAWSGSSPALDLASEGQFEVDPLGRPDCMDDVVAFAISVCSLGPDYASKFWSIETNSQGCSGEENDQVCVKLVPSKALCELKKQQTVDESLQSVYFSFLAVLSLAENPTGARNGNGADAVCEFFTSETDEATNKNHRSWLRVIELLRWYVRQLDPLEYSSSRAASVPSSSTGGSTSYYYFDSEYANDGKVSSDKSMSGERSSQVTPRELGAANEFILLSHLEVISNVTAHLPAARLAILAVNLNVRSADGSEILGQESSLMVLFALASMPLPPEIRGSVFRSIANLISIDGINASEATEFRNVATTGWELLESFGFVPITMLDQYPGQCDPSHQQTTGISFPQSSTSLAMGKNESSWIPPDARYSIIYELEYVESCQGCYPSTEGFLILLKALFVAGGSPLFLGQNWRSRPGCAPYVEYVINYILPRATGHFEHFPALPFRSSEDKSRLLLFALEVVDTVLIRYTVPVPRQDLKLTLEEQALESHKCAQNAATALIGNIVLGEDITVQPHVDDFRAFVVDFRSTEVSPPQDALSTSQSISSRSPVPPPKSPGFSVLAALLSASEHKLLRALVSCLFDFNVDTALHDFDMISMASTLYGNTPPTFASAKEGTMNTRRSMSRRLLVKSLRPEYVCMEKESYGQRAILVSLRILCVALAREDLFRDRANAEVGRISVVPVLRFSRYTLVPHSFDMDLLQVSQLLLSPDVTKGIVPTIVHLVGTVSANKRTDVEISSAAIALTFHIEQSIPRQDNAVGNVLRTALSRKVLEISRNPMSDSDLKFLHFVFDRLLLELRGKTSFAFLTEELFTNESTYQGRQDFLGSILSLLQSIDLAGDGVNLSPCICEVLYRLMATKTGSSDVGLALFTSTRLRAVDFWKTILVRIFSFLSANENYLESTTKDCLTHSVAWLLKGAAAELYLLIGFPNDFPLRLGDTRLLTAKASQFNILCRHLFSDIGFVAQALSILPIEILPTTRESFPSPDERTVGEAKQAIRGSPDVVNGYYTINAELLKIDARADQLLPNVKELNTWIDNWNHSVLRDCASAHLSHAIALVISSSMAGSEIMDFSLPQGCKVGVHTAIDILKRMDSMMASVACLDSFYLTACRNLVYAVRIATTSLEKNMDGSELALLGNLIIRGIASQASVNYQGPVANRRKELISDFACSLVHTIRAMNFPFFTRTDQDCIIRAATVLSELSGIVEIGHTVERTSSESLASRACLPMLLEILEETSSSDLSSPSCSVLTSTSGSSLSSTLMTSLLGLLPLFDDTVVCLLQRMVGLSPHVAALFRAHGIIEAIQNAATKYCDQEKTYLSLKSHGVQNRATQIQAPSFLVGHFELLSAVLASCSTREQKIDIASKIFSISQTYKPLLDRLLTTFPVDGDSLYAMLRCIAQCNALLYSKCGPTGSDTIDGFLIGDYLPVSLIASLAMHIAENPLPERFLGATPSRLQQPHVSIGVVVVQKTVQTSWWDGHDKPTASLIDGHVRLAALAMDLLRWMLTLIRRSSTETALNEFVLSRSILRCSSSALRIDEEIRKRREQGSTDRLDEVDFEQIERLSVKINDVVADLLLFTVARVREVKQTSSLAGRADSFCKALSFVLDLTHLESSTLGRLDENRLCLISKLSQDLRNEVELS